MSSNLILVINCGSSSLKFAIINPANGEELLSGLAECFNLPEARIKWKFANNKAQADLEPGAAHDQAFEFIVKNILNEQPELANHIIAIGHRVVHGGEKYTHSVRINEEVIAGIKRVTAFAPLHNPAHIIGIEAAFAHFPHLREKNVAVFDTAFHQTLAEAAYLYALPYALYRDHGVRRYGFHGISHDYISRKAAEILDKPLDSLNIISCHLGNGASITAIRGGKSVDTSMGLTPLEGLVMGTRCGDIDPAVIFYLCDHLGMSPARVNQLLTKESGLLGLTEVTSDCRYVEENYQRTENATRAMDVFCHHLAKYIASYTALMEDHLDALTFTGGIGENAALVRELTVNKLKLLGFKIDTARNQAARFGKTGYINQDGTPAMLVIPTNEELIIAQDTARLAS